MGSTGFFCNKILKNGFNHGYYFKQAGSSTVIQYNKKYNQHTRGGEHVILLNGRSVRTHILYPTHLLSFHAYSPSLSLFCSFSSPSFDWPSGLCSIIALFCVVWRRLPSEVVWISIRNVEMVCWRREFLSAQRDASFSEHVCFLVPGPSH